VGRNLSPNPNQEQPQEPRNKPINTNGRRRRRRRIRTPTLGKNPQTPTHGRNHTHFKNKPTNHKNGFGSGRERWAEFGPPLMVAMMVKGRAKEALPWNFKEQRRGFVVFYWSRFVISMLICLLLRSSFAFFFVISAFFFLHCWSLQLKSLDFFLHFWSLQLETHGFGFHGFLLWNSSLKDPISTLIFIEIESLILELL